MEHHLLYNSLVILGLALFITLTFSRIGIPVIIGFFLTGILIGPGALGLVQTSNEVLFLAELGIILLLFTVGIDFSLEKLLRMRRLVLLGGSTQVLITILVAALSGFLMGVSLKQAIFYGMVFSLSSTAIILNLFQKNYEVDTPHGRFTLSILIFQDIAVVFMIFLLPFLVADSTHSFTELPLIFLKGIGIVLMVYVLGRRIVPFIFDIVFKSRQGELFILSVVFTCFTIAGVTSWSGLSLALGAFLAGLIISESIYSHHVLDHILPFKDTFSAIFFMSVGMMLPVSFLLNNIGSILMFSFLVIIIKALICSAAGFLLRLPPQTAIRGGLVLSQVGEFSIVLLNMGHDYSLLTRESLHFLLALAVVTMALTPFLVTFSERFSSFLVSLPFFKRVVPPETLSEEQQSNHIILVGYGPTGKLIADILQERKIPFIILEMNPQTVRTLKTSKIPVILGDAGKEHILERAGVKTALALVISMNLPGTALSIVRMAKHLNPAIQIVSRSRFTSEVSKLKGAGATAVVSDELESSINLLARTLETTSIPHQEIASITDTLRATLYPSDIPGADHSR